MVDLVVIVPSRGRPQAAAELAEAFYATRTADTELIFALDDNDPALRGYPMNASWVGPSRSMVEALNEAAINYANQHDPPFAVGFMGDDHRPRTAGWDERYLEALRELGTGLVYGNDLFQRERLPTQVAMTADLVRWLGYMAPPGLRHMYVDNAWLALGKALGRITYLPGVIVEHMHPLVHKGAWDEGYARVNHPDVYAADRVAFGRWLREMGGLVDDRNRAHA